MIARPKSNIQEVNEGMMRHESFRMLVEDKQRLVMIPKYCGRTQRGMSFDILVFNIMSELSDEYSGGYWHYYELSNSGFYMSLADDANYTLHDANGGAHTMSADAASIAVCIIAFNRLSWHFDGKSDRELQRFLALYERLMEYAYMHPEFSQIYRIID